MFGIRLRSGIILLAVAALLLISGGPLLFAGSLILSLIGMSELFRILGFERQILGIIAYLTAGVYYAVVYLDLGDWLLMILVLGFLALMASYVFTYPRYRAEQVIMAFFGVFYVAVMLSYLYQIRSLPNGVFLVWMVFISSWGCDTCAYCVGMLLGKHKMTPLLSPKKSIEGAVGGIVGTGLLGMLYGWIFGRYLTIFIHPVLVLGVICAVGGAIAMIGDLTASAIKRCYEIKDFGTLIPGHGGILDRFDSVIITAPLVYYLILLLQQFG